MDFRPLNDTERRQLISALRGNAESDRAILMDRRDTSFAGTTDEVTDDEVITAIKSVPCHYWLLLARSNRRRSSVLAFYRLLATPTTGYFGCQWVF